MVDVAWPLIDRMCLVLVPSHCDRREVRPKQLLLAYVDSNLPQNYCSCRLVPALNVIATHYNIPSDIAGATLMAAGASSPELFSSIVSLFITHSSLGLGTIVGSEIFNQLIICAGAVYASKNGELVLDKAVVTREVGFYALGIALLYYALRDSESDPEDPDGVEHIFISFLDAALLVGGYLLYVIVCANMESILEWFGGREEDEDNMMKSLRGDGYGTMDVEGNHFKHRDTVTKTVSSDYLYSCDIEKRSIHSLCGLLPLE